MIIGTAGHIDHGKTSLVRALTGVDTDRLKEEKARGISIELGYAYTPVSEDEVLGFVDVPGHERLVHTMVAGAGGIDYVLLVVAADDGVMPQTREHLAILELLNVRRGAVALSKIDRVSEARVSEVQAQVAALLKPTSLADAPLFPVIATDAENGGVATLRAHLQAAALAWPRRRADGFFRLAVDRVFTLPGRGTVATGTAHAGQVRIGDALAVMPSGVGARVRSIHAQNRETDVGRAGQRCALNLAGIDKAALARGDWLADPRALLPSTRIDVRLRRLAGAAALKKLSPLHVHLGTAHRIARVLLLEGDVLPPGSQARAQLIFETPICAAPGDLFIARDAQALHTIGGGVVLDPVAPARRRRAPTRLAYLDAIERLLDGGGIEALLRNSPQGLSLAELGRICGRAAEHIVMPEDARIIDAGGEQFAFLGSQWSAVLGRATEALREFHAQQPEEPGIDRGRLRRMTAPTIADSVWRAAVDELVHSRVLRRTGNWLHLPEHRVTLNGREVILAEKLATALAAGGFDPPWVRDLAAALRAPDDEVRLVLRKCMMQGAVYSVVRDLYYHRDSVRALAQVLKGLIHDRGAVQAAEYRDAIGLGRKRTVQILEFFDRVGYTRRIHEARVLRADSSWLDEG
ncbi:MAG TPA: selenocysteine-specific translation elongation factor [Steroidobacteraceae bacterium]